VDSDLPRGLEPPVGRRHVAGEDRLERGGEEVGTLEEEGTLLRVEEREPLVDVELERVGFDLREVGVDRGVEDQVRRHPPGGGETEIGLYAARFEAVGCGFRPPVGALGGDRRIELDGVTGSEAREAGDERELADGAGAVPVLRLARELIAEVARPDPDEGDAPGLDPVALREAERGERDPHLYLVAGRGEAPGRCPDRVPGRILAAAAAEHAHAEIVEEEVHLDAERVDVEGEGAAAIV